MRRLFLLLGSIYLAVCANSEMAYSYEPCRIAVDTSIYSHVSDSLIFSAANGSYSSGRENLKSLDCNTLRPNAPVKIEISGQMGLFDPNMCAGNVHKTNHREYIYIDDNLIAKFGSTNFGQDKIRVDTFYAHINSDNNGHYSQKLRLVCVDTYCGDSRDQPPIDSLTLHPFLQCRGTLIVNIWSGD